MNYQQMGYQDQFPAVATMQALLVRQRLSVKVDGEFGQRTVDKLKLFQQSQNLTPAHGTVDEPTWHPLSMGMGLRIIDVVDGFDEALRNLEAADIENEGDHPIIIAGISNGIQKMIEEIKRVQAGNVWILRLHGHGKGGHAGVSAGHSIPKGETYSVLANDTLLKLRSQLSSLSSMFGPYGCIQLMHCKVAEGYKGQVFVQTFANIMNLPVTAAYKTQQGGGARTFAFEGATYSAFPRGLTLKSWAARLPPFRVITGSNPEDNISR